MSNPLSENADKLRLPAGTILFKMDTGNLLEGDSCLVAELVAGRHAFNLKREGEYMIFRHSTPMAGTVMSLVSMAEVDTSGPLQIALIWNPRWCKLMLKGAEQQAFVQGTQEISPKGYWVSPKGQVFQVGNQGVQVFGVTMYEGGNKILEPPAVEGWRECLRAIDLLRELETQNHIQEIARSAPAIVALATGLEYFLKRRFCEMEGEGFPVNYESLAAEIYPADVANGQLTEHQAMATTDGVDYCHYVAQVWRSGRALNFQSLDSAKKLFRKAYGISIPQAVGTDAWHLMLDLMQWRHVLVHVSPLSEMLEPPASGKEPVFLSSDLVRETEGILREAVDAMMVAMGLGSDEKLE